MSRQTIPDFVLAKALYRNASVSFYTVANGVKTSTLATLYENQTGSDTLANPQVLDSHGKFRQPVYIAVPVIGTIEGISVPGHDTGIIPGYGIDFRVSSTTGEFQYSLDGGDTWEGSGYYGGKEAFVIAASDEATPITAGTAKVTFRMPYAMTLTAVRASLKVAQTSGSIFTVNINEGGTSLLSTKLTVDNGEKTSTTAATAAVISDSSIADDAEITVDVDQIGVGDAAGLKVYLIGVKTS